MAEKTVIEVLQREYKLAEKRMRAAKAAIEAFSSELFSDGDKRTVSPASRKKMALAAKKRWAAKKAQGKTKRGKAKVVGTAE